VRNSSNHLNWDERSPLGQFKVAIALILRYLQMIYPDKFAMLITTVYPEKNRRIGVYTI
jgi:hypothetical protein